VRDAKSETQKTQIKRPKKIKLPPARTVHVLLLDMESETAGEEESRPLCKENEATLLTEA
jgi:hypothetical protein